jgi:hypothetical protein
MLLSGRAKRVHKILLLLSISTVALKVDWL